MQNMIEQYDGMIDFYEKNGMFVVDMMVKREDKDTKQEAKATKHAINIDEVKKGVIM